MFFWTRDLWGVARNRHWFFWKTLFGKNRQKCPINRVLDFSKMNFYLLRKSHAEKRGSSLFFNLALADIALFIQPWQCKYFQVEIHFHLKFFCLNFCFTAELGDFDPAVHTEHFLSEFRFVPHQVCLLVVWCD